MCSILLILLLLLFWHRVQLLSQGQLQMQCVVQAGIRFIIFLPQPPDSQNHKCMLSFQAIDLSSSLFFIIYIFGHGEKECWSNSTRKEVTEADFRESFLSFRHVGPEDQTQVVRPWSPLPVPSTSNFSSLLLSYRNENFTVL